MIYGFSTGALAKGDYRCALAVLEPHRHDAIELSALRMAELPGLIAALPSLPLGRYDHVSLHAPSHFSPSEEPAIVEQLEAIADRVDGIVVHAEAIRDPNVWTSLGDKVLVENADGRKATGRTFVEFRRVLDSMPDARVCFDLAHVYQVDPTLVEARRILQAFSDRIGELHLSQLDHRCRHEPLRRGIVREYQRLASMIPLDTPVIVESCVPPNLIPQQVDLARACFERSVEEHSGEGARLVSAACY